MLDRKHFKKAIADAEAMNCNLIHLSCHGGEDGIALADNYQPSWLCRDSIEFLLVEGLRVGILNILGWTQ